MILIAHRGNINGRKPDRENHPDYIHEALLAGFDAEVDLWKIGGRYFLGHDKPRHEVSYEFLLRKAGRLWIHAKDVQALEAVLQEPCFNVFCHEHDTRTITTKGYIWTRSGQEDFCTRSILLELNPTALPESAFAGVCSNFPEHFAKERDLRQEVEAQS